MKNDNSTMNNFFNQIINKTKAINMHFKWLKCRQAQEQFYIYLASGQVNLTNYITKHHPPVHQRALGPIYLPYNKENKQIDIQWFIKLFWARLGKVPKSILSSIEQPPYNSYTSSLNSNYQNAPAWEIPVQNTLAWKNTSISTFIPLQASMKWIQMLIYW